MSEILRKTREICNLLEIKPARSKGQNFLITEKFYDQMIKAAELSPQDLVLEVGPGLGFLTAKLAEEVERVIAVELDDKLANYLRMAIASQDVDNISLVNQDILRFDLQSFLKQEEINNKSYKIVANLPYNISSIFLRTFLSSSFKPELITLMLQKEVAERIVALAPDSSLLSLSIAFYGEAEIVKEVKAGNFWPEPKVDSAIIKIRVKKAKDIEASILENIKGSSSGLDFAVLEKLFFRLLKISFSSKRKMIKNNLAGGLKITTSEAEKLIILAGLNPKARAEDLNLENFLKLFATTYQFMV